MAQVVSIEFFEWTPRILDIKENNNLIEQIETPASEPSLYEALNGTNAITVRNMLRDLLNGRKLSIIYMHGCDKPEKYADVFDRIIFQDTLYGRRKDIIAEVMQFLSESDKQRYRRTHEHDEYVTMRGKRISAYRIPERDLRSVINSKAINQALRNVYESKTGQDSRPGFGALNTIRSFAGIKVPKGAEGGRRKTNKSKKEKGRKRKLTLKK